mgnify:CR=1 FL=1|tara:strand:- start:145 stop:393 length:249 start_codon:yes stop_codon:yes gene_type:complete
MTEIEHLIAIQTRLERIEGLLRFEQEDDTYMTIREASDYTRYSVTTLRSAQRDGHLECVNQGGRGGKTIFKKSHLTDWLEGE